MSARRVGSRVKVLASNSAPVAADRADRPAAPGALFRRLEGGLGWIALALVLTASLALGGNRPASWLLLSVGLLGLLVLQGALSLARGPRRLPTERLLAPALLYAAACGWGLLQVIPGLLPAAWMHPSWDNLALLGLPPWGGPTVSADPTAGYHALMRLTAYAAAFWLAAIAAADGERARAMIRAIAVFSGALAAYGVWARAAGQNPILGPELTANVVQASFVNRNHYATYAAFGALANLAALSFSVGGGAADATAHRRQAAREALRGFFRGGWIYALGALLCIGAVALTQSRAGAASAVFGLVVAILAFARGGGRQGKALAAILLILLGFAAMSLSAGLFERALATSKESARFLVYPEIWAMILERPWLGHGLGAFHETFRAAVPFAAAVGEWDYAHNTWLELLFELGLPACGALFAALALIGLRLIRGARERRRNRWPACLALGAAATAGLHGLFDFSLQMPAAAALFAVLLGIGWAQSHPTRPASGGPGRDEDQGTRR